METLHKLQRLNLRQRLCKGFSFARSLPWEVYGQATMTLALLGGLNEAKRAD